ncbi:ABATE domain-containing protein [Streptomyces sp. LP05-1]|uniref:ABATE domain-containing protein n=1 Tax=Streptomyces pyxinae TaxID=2970734 RepID=A0ABT2CIZ7_9ACTN|nr:ABATE domain-containing protein [Streptomyces sp. LP05-1]MCS0637390.1 ABATE domain-containing protein [Streptomyces sp. LP05-1]
MADSARTGAESQPLCLRFTKTAADRLAPAPRERLRRPADLAEWLATAGLGAGESGEPPSVDEELLREARELREAIYRAARSVASGERPAGADREHINAWAARNDAYRVLGDTGVHWRFPGASPARSALAVLAADAVETLGGVRTGTVKVCAGSGCVAVFLDTSRGRSRRWCSMGTCGNRAKKDAMRVRQEG